MPKRTAVELRLNATALLMISKAVDYYLDNKLCGEWNSNPHFFHFPSESDRQSHFFIRHFQEREAIGKLRKQIAYNKELMGLQDAP